MDVYPHARLDPPSGDAAFYSQFQEEMQRFVDRDSVNLNRNSAASSPLSILSRTPSPWQRGQATASATSRQHQDVPSNLAAVVSFLLLCCQCASDFETAYQSRVGQLHELHQSSAE